MSKSIRKLIDEVKHIAVQELFIVIIPLIIEELIGKDDIANRLEVKLDECEFVFKKNLLLIEIIQRRSDETFKKFSQCAQQPPSDVKASGGKLK